MIEDTESIGQRIKNLRKQLKLSQDEMGDMVQLNRSTVNNIERGHQRPSIDFIIRLSEITGESTDAILRGSDDRDIAAQTEKNHALLRAIVKEKNPGSRQLLADKIEEELTALRDEVATLRQSGENKDLEMADLRKQLTSIGEMIRQLSGGNSQ